MIPELILGSLALLAMVITIVGIIIGSYGERCTDNGRELGRGQERQRAIEAGVAAYVADPTTGEASFIYRKHP